MEHTPIPWERDATHIFTTGEPGANVCSVSSPRKSDFVEYTRLEIGDPDFNEAMANAAFIVQAVNNHDELVAFIEGLFNCKDADEVHDYILTNAGKVLANAKS